MPSELPIANVSTSSMECPATPPAVAMTYLNVVTPELEAVPLGLSVKSIS